MVSRLELNLRDDSRQKLILWEIHKDVSRGSGNEG